MLVLTDTRLPIAFITIITGTHERPSGVWTVSINRAVWKDTGSTFVNIWKRREQNNNWWNPISYTNLHSVLNCTGMAIHQSRERLVFLCLSHHDNNIVAPIMHWKQKENKTGVRCKWWCNLHIRTVCPHWRHKSYCYKIWPDLTWPFNCNRNLLQRQTIDK